MNNILSGFLSANLLPIGEDDEKLRLLDSAADALAKEVAGDPLLAYRCALVGLDERVPASDPVHTKVGEIIATKWLTMTNKTGAGPVQVHRAVLLRAIEIVGTESRDLRFAMTLIPRNLGSVSQDDKAKRPIAAMLANWESAVAEDLNGAWVNTVDMSLPKLAGKLKRAQVNKEELAAAFGRASGPQDKDGKPYPTPNAHWPNAGDPWSYEFAPRAAEAVYTAVQSGAKGYAEDMQEAVREIVLGWSASLERLAMRDAKTELLWIRTSQYSPSARAGFRSLNPTDITLHAVIDVSRMVTKLAPPSVEFFLRELVTELAPERARLSDFLTTIGPKIASLPEGKAIAADKLPALGRRSWLDCSVRGLGAGDFMEQTGVSGEHEEPLGELAVKLYRELQIRKLLACAS
jgi:hypothetical protein